jgi:type IV pilus assembly protein PilW
MIATNIQRERGFSLPELMVALTISLLIMAGVASIFVSSKKAYTTQERLARTQENGRFAMFYLLRDIRMAGYLGCLSGLNTEKINNTLNTPNSFSFNFSIPIEGTNDVVSGTSTWYPSTTVIPADDGNGNAFARAGTDLLALRLVDPSTQIGISDPMPNSSAELKVGSTSGFNIGDIILLSDCSSADIMQITQVQAASGHLQHNAGGAGSPGNSTQKLQKAYDSKAKTFKFSTRRYFIRNNPSNIPALYMDSNGGAASELAEGIEDMQVLYGVDTDGDRQPNRYLKAGDAGLTTQADWSNVVSVRIGVLARTLDTKDTDVDTQTYDVNGKSVTPCPTPSTCTDRNQRRVFLATVLLRNLANP